MERYRIAVADDHVMFRQGLRKLMEGVPDLEIVGEAGDGTSLRSLLASLRPQMVILDLSMPNVRGIDALSEIKTKHPDTKVLILTMHKEYLHQALCAGTDGYLLKEDADRELFSAIENIRQGQTYVSPRLTRELSGDRSFLSGALSTREEEVLRLIAEGKTNKEVADMLFISVRTVETHRAHVMAKLNLNSTAEIVRYALRNGYV